MRRGARRGLGLVAAAVLLGAFACARIRPLDGGPPDEEPPRLVAATPRDSTTGLSRQPRFELEWSEALNTITARAGVRIEPPVRFEVRAKGRRVTVTVLDTLPADTTVVLRLAKSIRDRGERDNPLAREIALLYSTGPRLESGAVLGKLTVKGKPEPKAAIRWEPAVPRAGRPRPAGPLAAVDAEGLFRLVGIPPEERFLLRGFVDRNENRTPDEGELGSVYPDTLRLAVGEVRRGLDWNLVDPDEPAELRGFATNETQVRGPVALAFRRLEPAPGSRPDSFPPDSTEAPVRADTLRPLPWAVPARDSTSWARAYAALEPRGFLKREWVLVYASPRGDYSVRVAPGRHVRLAFVDARRDSAPGLYVLPDSSRLGWEPLTSGDTLYTGPGEKTRLRAIDVR